MATTSIKKRITAYYATVLVIFVILAAILVALSSSLYIHRTARHDLADAVENGFDKLTYDGKTLQIDKDFDTYYRGVTLVIYDKNGERLKGGLPGDFPQETLLDSGEYTDIKAKNDHWLIYDSYHDYGDNVGLWIRGIYSMDNRMDSAQSLMSYFLVALPLFALVALFVGYMIARRSFKPVTEITETVNRIGAGDLSERIPEGATHDEMYHLTVTLNDMLSRLETAFESEKQFSYDVSHELRTPLAIILTECEYALANEDNPEGYREALLQIQERARRMRSLTGQLLQMSRTMEKETLLEKEKLDFSTLCESAAESMQYEAADADVTLTTDIEDGIELVGDEGLLLRLVMNLLQNAIKYRDDTKKECTVHLSLHQGADDALLSVADNGIGISEENKSKIFRRFFKADIARSQRDDSFGIGLALCQWIAQAHDAEISVDSKLGSGSTFMVRFPKTS